MPENWVLGEHVCGVSPSRYPPELRFFSLLSRTTALGVSFGLVACVLGLVLSLCFAEQFLVSVGGAHRGLGPWRYSPRGPAPGTQPAELCPSEPLPLLPGEQSLSAPEVSPETSAFPGLPGAPKRLRLCVAPRVGVSLLSEHRVLSSGHSARQLPSRVELPGRSCPICGALGLWAPHPHPGPPACAPPCLGLEPGDWTL